MDTAPPLALLIICKDASMFLQEQKGMKPSFLPSVVAFLFLRGSHSPVMDHRKGSVSNRGVLEEENTATIWIFCFSYSKVAFSVLQVLGIKYRC